MRPMGHVPAYKSSMIHVHIEKRHLSMLMIPLNAPVLKEVLASAAWHPTQQAGDLRHCHLL